MNIDISAILLLINNALMLVVGYCLKWFLTDVKNMNKRLTLHEKQTAVNEAELKTELNNTNKLLTKIETKIDTLFTHK